MQVTVVVGQCQQDDPVSLLTRAFVLPVPRQWLHLTCFETRSWLAIKLLISPLNGLGGIHVPVLCPSVGTRCRLSNLSCGGQIQDRGM